MKSKITMFFGVFILLTSLVVKASANNFGSRLNALNGREGEITGSYDKNNSGRCRLELEGSHDGLIISLQDTGMYFTPTAILDANSVFVDSDTVLVSTNSNRPGGDACGDWGGAVGYKKVVVLKGNELTIRESFRCSFEAFKKYDLFTTCRF